MSEERLELAGSDSRKNPSDRLDSWKELATYLRRDVRTLQRWEKEEGLPVHRHKHLRGNTVYAYPEELDEWWRTQAARLNSSSCHSLEERDHYRVGRTLALGAAVLLFGAGTGYWLLDPVSPVPSVVPLTAHPGHERQPTLSPDGLHVAFSWGENVVSPHSLFVEEIDGSNRWRRSAGARTAYSPAWSHGGKTIAFLQRNEDESASVVLIAPFFGAEQVLTEVQAPPEEWGRQIAWSHSDRDLVVTHSPEPSSRYALFVVSVATGQVTRLTSPPRAFVDHSPSISPDGGVVAFIRALEKGAGDLCVLPLAGNTQPAGEVRTLTTRSGQIFCPTWSLDGQTLYFSSGLGSSLRLWKISASGGRAELVEEIQNHIESLAITSTGLGVSTQLVTDYNIYHRKIGEDQGKLGEPIKWIASSRNDWSPQHAPDRSRIAFLSDRSGQASIWVCEADGSAPMELPTDLTPYSGIISWSPDGKWIAFDSHIGGNSDIYLICADTRSEHGLCCQGPNRCTRRLTEHEAEDLMPSWSQSQGWLYFSSSRDGQFNIWKVATKGGEPVRITTNGGIYADESIDGESLIYGQWPVSGIARLNLSDGSEDLLVEGLSYPFWQDENGLYYLDRDGGYARGYNLWHYDWISGQTRRVLTGNRLIQGFSILDSDASILYTQLDREDADLVQILNLSF